MSNVIIRDEEILDQVKHALDVGTYIYMGPAPNGARYEVHLLELMETLAAEAGEESFEDQLNEAALDGVRDFLRTRRESFRKRLNEYVAASRAENEEAL